MPKPRKNVLTTGEIARICNVAPRTVSKWFDSGQLRGYRIPGSRDRRVPVDQLIRFMRAHGIPYNGLVGEETRILIVDRDPDVIQLVVSALSNESDLAVRGASNLLEAGIVAASFKPGVVVLEVDLPGAPLRELVQTLRTHPDVQIERAIALTGPLRDADRRALLDQGFNDCLVKPFDVPALLQLVMRHAEQVS